jgi:hypothetical protein
MSLLTRLFPDITIHVFAGDDSESISTLRDNARVKIYREVLFCFVCFQSPYYNDWVTFAVSTHFTICDTDARFSTSGVQRRVGAQVLPHACALPLRLPRYGQRGDLFRRRSQRVRHGAASAVDDDAAAASSDAQISAAVARGANAIPRWRGEFYELDDIN